MSIEHRVRAIWTEVLGIEQVGDDEGFLDLGGDSISASLCVNQIRAAFGVEIEMGALLIENLSLRALAGEIDRALVASA
jgi:acyl carrier protein